MRRAPVVTAILVFLMAVSGVAVWSLAEAQGNSELAGAWIVTSRETADGQVNSEPQRGLYVFTVSGHYSMMFVLGDQPRVEFGSEENPTDAEKVTAFDSIVANSGRYTVEGNEISYEAYMAKYPNYMAAFDVESRANAETMTFDIQDGVLTLRPTSGPAQGATVTLRRPGQPSD